MQVPPISATSLNPTTTTVQAGQPPTASGVTSSSESAVVGLASIGQHRLTTDLVSAIQSNQGEVGQNQALEAFQAKLEAAYTSLSDQELSQLNHEFKNLMLLNPSLAQTPLFGFGISAFNKITNSLLAETIKRYCQAENLNHTLSRGLQLYFGKNLDQTAFLAQGDNIGESRPAGVSTISDLIVQAAKFDDLELLRSLANQAEICESKIPFTVFSLERTIQDAMSSIPSNLTSDRKAQIETVLTAIANKAESIT